MRPLHDLRIALRSLLRRPTFTSVAVLTLALGIGANAAIFSFVDAIAFRPLPVSEPDRLVAVFPTDREGEMQNFSFPDYRELRRALRRVEGLAAFSERPVSVARGGETPQLAWGMLVSEGYFPLLGLRPRAGRLFTDEEMGRDGSGGAPAVLVSDRFFRRRLGGDERAIGRPLTLNGHPFTVVGVLPAGFQGTRLFSYAPDLWLPVAQHLVLDPASAGWLDSPTGGSFQLLGRLAAGADREAAEAEALVAVRRIAAIHGAQTGRTGVRVFSNRTAINPWATTPEQMRGIALLALAGVAVVLVVACANVANLMLARASGRARELAVRASLGAGRGPLLRLLLAEATVLALLGGAAGVLVGWLGSRAMLRLLPDLEYELAVDPRLDGRFLLFTLAVSLLGALASGVLPGLRAARVDPAGEIRGAAGGHLAGRRLRHLLVGTQVAFSVVVLVAAGLFVRSLSVARGMDLGFRPAGALVFGIDPNLAGYDSEASVRLEERLAEALAALPGVEGVTWADDLPLDGNSSSTRVSVLGRSTRTEDRASAFHQSVAPGHFAVMGIPLLAGRGFVEADREREIEPVVVSAGLARELWRDEQKAVGQRVLLGTDAPPVEVIGVAADVKANWLGEEGTPALYFDRRREIWGRAWFVVRHQGDLGALAPQVRRAVAAIDPSLPLTRIETLGEHLAAGYAAPENGAWLATAFGLLALLLAASGVYGVIAFAVARRTREMAIRMAVGAAPLRVVRDLLSRSLRVVAIGVGCGLAGAWGVGRLLRGLLYGVSPNDPATLGGVAALLCGVALLASLLPARRMLRLDPSRALRAED